MVPCLEERRRVEQIPLPRRQEDDLRRRRLQDLECLELEVAVGERARPQALCGRLPARPLDLLLRLGLGLRHLLLRGESVLRRHLLALDRRRELLRKLEVVDQEVDDVDRELVELLVEPLLDLLADLLPVRCNRDALELDGLVLEDLKDPRRDDLAEEARADLGVQLLDRLVRDLIVERDNRVDGLGLLADRRAAADPALDRGRLAIVHLELDALDLRRDLLRGLPGRDRLEPRVALADDLAELADDEHVTGVDGVEGTPGAPAADHDDHREQRRQDPRGALVALPLPSKTDTVDDRHDGDDRDDRRDDQIAHSGGGISRLERDSSRARRPLRAFAIARARKAVIAIELATIPRMTSTFSTCGSPGGGFASLACELQARLGRRERACP